MKNFKSFAIVTLTGAALLVALDQFLLKRDKKGWKVNVDLSSSGFLILGKKEAKSKKA